MLKATPSDAKKIKAVLFDLDGTLADTMNEITAAMNRALRRFGFPERTYSEMRSFINYGVYELVRLAFPPDSTPELLEKALDIYQQYYAEIYLETKKPYDGMFEVVDYLRENGYKTGVLSNKTHLFTVNMTKELFGAERFDFILGLGKFERKPVPDAAYYAADTLGVKTSEIAFIGDSQVDMQFAKNSGMVSVGVTWGYRDEPVLIREGADYIVRQPLELISTIAAMA